MNSAPELLKEYETLLVGHWITDISNTAAFVYHGLPQILWCGFYLLENGELKLGPFQGMPACTSIQLGSGVCGKVARTLESEVVDDVHAFAGHIVCDVRARSELVVPLIKNGNLLGVFDLDSEFLARFKAEDLLFIERIVTMLILKN
jgi:L-methionine (R)-S-oxide reductase